MTPEMHQQLEARRGWMKEHLPYEIRTLVGVHKRLDWTEPRLEGLEQDVYIESYCVHARNIIELFLRESSVTTNGGGFERWSNLTEAFQLSAERYGEHVRMLNNQISHLGYERESLPTNKIDRTWRVALTKMLRTDLANFNTHLKPMWKQYPLPDIPDFPTDEKHFVRVTGAPMTTSSEFQSVTATFPAAFKDT